MGRSLKVVLLKQTNMKLLLVLAAAGLSCATPEADPQNAPSANCGGRCGLAYAYAPYAYHLGYSGLVYRRKKREAKAEADAQFYPWLFYGHDDRDPFAHPYAYAQLAGCRDYLGGLVPCAGR